MIIQIDGINTLNKGAELMLVAILEELEKKYPGENVYINPDSIFDKNQVQNYNLKIKKRFGRKIGRVINAICFKLNISHPIAYLKENYAPKNVDIILDASGFKYSDQWDRKKSWLDSKEKYYKRASENKTKIYFLTQAFGPFKTENGIRSVHILSNYSNLIFAREEMSYNYLLEANANPNKVKVSCDFTLKVAGIVPKKYEHLKGSVAIIPNKKMITHGGNHADKYVNLFLKLINYFWEKGEKVFLLNHEAEGDFELCKLINTHLENKLDIVSGITAKEVKGVIGLSKIVISSRFHGVASALSQGVPCLATSWNHKYEMLFKNFGQENCVINANNTFDENLKKVDDIYINYEVVSEKIKSAKPNLVKQIDNMWNIIFEDYEK